MLCADQLTQLTLNYHVQQSVQFFEHSSVGRLPNRASAQPGSAAQRQLAAAGGSAMLQAPCFLCIALVSAALLSPHLTPARELLRLLNGEPQLEPLSRLAASLPAARRGCMGPAMTHKLNATNRLALHRDCRPPPPPSPPQTLPVRPVAAAAAKQLSVVVASQNAVKINAVATALRQALPGTPHTITGARRGGEAGRQHCASWQSAWHLRNGPLCTSRLAQCMAPPVPCLHLICSHTHCIHPASDAEQAASHGRACPTNRGETPRRWLARATEWRLWRACRSTAAAF